MKRKFFKANLDIKLDPNDPRYQELRNRQETTEDEANLVSSLKGDDFNFDRLDYDVRHYPVLDLDFPCQLIPSSTWGKFHLYMDKEVTWLQYQVVLAAMAEAGLLEPGYVSASFAAKSTFVRKPGVFKIAK